MSRTSGLVSLALVLAACGGDKKDGPGGGGSAGAGTGSAAAPGPLTVPPLGVDAVRRLNYIYGTATKEHAKVVAAYKASPRDWGAIRTAAEATLAKDADHLDARWALGEALAGTGEPARAAEALLAALAADWLRWGPTLAKDPELATFLTTPHGQALLEASAKLGAAVDEAIARQPLVLARRGPWKLPAPGTSYAATRGELYAYDLEQKRFLRLTHTDHTVAAALRAPSGELLLAGYTQAQVADPAKVAAAGSGKAAGTAAAPLLTKSWISAWSPKDRTVTAAKGAIPKARFVTAGYGPGEQIVVSTATATGRWGPGISTTYVVDRATGKLTRQAGAATDGRELRMSLDDVEIVDGPHWPGGLLPSVAEQFSAVVASNADGTPRIGTAELSPSAGRIAFATRTDPCTDGNEAAQPSLYVADAKTGAHKHVLTAASRFGVLWLDDDRLLYEDGSGALRLFDAAAGRETGKITERAGLALHVLPPSPAPLCQSEPPADDPTAVDELPPEEAPATDPTGPVTDPT